MKKRFMLGLFSLCCLWGCSSAAVPVSTADSGQTAEETVIETESIPETEQETAAESEPEVIRNLIREEYTSEALKNLPEGANILSASEGNIFYEIADGNLYQYFAATEQGETKKLYEFSLDQTAAASAEAANQGIVLAQLYPKENTFFCRLLLLDLNGANVILEEESHALPTVAPLGDQLLIHCRNDRQGRLIRWDMETKESAELSNYSFITEEDSSFTGEMVMAAGGNETTLYYYLLTLEKEYPELAQNKELIQYSISGDAILARAKADEPYLSLFGNRDCFISSPLNPVDSDGKDLSGEISRILPDGAIETLQKLTEIDCTNEVLKMCCLNDSEMYFAGRYYGLYYYNSKTNELLQWDNLWNDTNGETKWDHLEDKERIFQVNEEGIWTSQKGQVYLYHV